MVAIMIPWHLVGSERILEISKSQLSFNESLFARWFFAII